MNIVIEDEYGQALITAVPDHDIRSIIIRVLNADHIREVRARTTRGEDVQLSLEDYSE